MENPTGNRFLSLPEEVLMVIVLAVADSSCLDIFRLQRTCSLFRRLGNEEEVLAAMSLDDLIPPPRTLVRLQPQEAFFERCLNAGNEQAVFIWAFPRFIRGDNGSPTLEHLQRAAFEQQFEPAVYVFGLLGLCSDRHNINVQGMGLLDTLEMPSNEHRRLFVQRVRHYLDGFLGNDPRLRRLQKFTPPRLRCVEDECIGVEFLEGWGEALGTPGEPESEYDNLCNRCFWDREAQRLVNRFNARIWI